MAQYDFGTIDPNTKSGTALASDLNSWRNALHSTHGGTSAPSYITAGMLWLDTTAANYRLKLYDGAQSIDVAIIDATNNVARVAVDSAATSYITATTAAQIKHVIASVDTMTVRSTGLQFNIAAPVIADNNNNELISFTRVASAVNQVNISNSATTAGPTISSAGGDANIDLLLTTQGTGLVYVYNETAATNSIINALRVEARSSGTPATGIGVGLLFGTETSANNYEIGARIEAVTTDVTAASEDFDLVFKVMAAGATATEVARLTSDGDLTLSGGAVKAVSSFIDTGPNTTALNNVLVGYRAGIGVETGNPGAIRMSGDGAGNVAAVTVEVGGAERFRFASSGQLGIGGTNYGTAGQVITSNGSGAAPSWGTPIFSKEFTSADQTITSAGALTLAHGLGAAPKLVFTELVCAVGGGVGGYAAGDVLSIGLTSTTTGDNRFTGVYYDATNIYVRYDDNANVFVYANKTTGATSTLTNSDWRLRVRAFA